MLSEDDEPITPVHTKRQRTREQSDSALDSSFFTEGNTSFTEVRPPREPLTYFQTCVLEKIGENERVLAKIAAQQVKVLHLCKKVLKINPSYDDQQETIARLLPCSNFPQFDHWEKQLDGKYVSNFPSFYYHC